MSTLNTIYLNVFSLIILASLLFNAHDRSEKVFLKNKLFVRLIVVNIFMIITDMLSWAFNLLPGNINYILNNIFNLLLFLVEPIVGVLWIYYCDLQAHHDESRINRIKYPLMALLIINGAMSVISLYTGWFFKVEPNNVYHRGTIYWFHIALSYSLLVYASCSIFLNRKMIERRYYVSLLLFPVPQAIGGILQALFYGMSISWSGMALSMLLIYFNIQNRGLSTDYLTGAYNRRQLDYYIRQKIRNSSEARSFSAVLIDLDKFKDINDTYGHDAGDETLRMTVNLMRKCLKNNDFIARYGGDEFCIVLDICDMDMLEGVVDRINACIDEFNVCGRPFKISFSLGYDIYDYKSKQSHEDFLKHIDMLMYKDKKRKYLA